MYLCTYIYTYIYTYTCIYIYIYIYPVAFGISAPVPGIGGAVSKQTSKPEVRTPRKQQPNKPRNQQTKIDHMWPKTLSKIHQTRSNMGPKSVQNRSLRGSWGLLGGSWGVLGAKACRSHPGATRSHPPKGAQDDPS